MNNSSRLIVPRMDPPMKTTKTETKDGILVGNINLHEPSNRRTFVNSVELFSPTPRE